MARDDKRVYPTNEPPRFYWEIWRDRSQGYIPYFWEELTSQAMIFFLFLGVIGGVALLWPADLAQPANVLVTPAGIKPEWYFLGLFQLIKVIPELAGAHRGGRRPAPARAAAVHRPQPRTQSPAQAGHDDDRHRHRRRARRAHDLGGGDVVSPEEGT